MSSNEGTLLSTKDEADGNGRMNSSLSNTSARCASIPLISMLIVQGNMKDQALGAAARRLAAAQLSNTAFGGTRFNSVRW